MKTEEFMSTNGVATAAEQLQNRLNDPKIADGLNRLLDHIEIVAFAVESMEQFISRGDTISDNLAGLVAELNLGDLNIDTNQLQSLKESLPKLKQAGEKLLDSELMGDGLSRAIDAAVGMVESGMLDKDVVSVLGELGKKSAETYQEVSSNPVAPVGGLFATLQATKDPDVQKSVGFFFAFAKAFAKHIK